MAEYSRMARGSFISSGQAQVINLPFQPDYVEFFNYTLIGTAATSQNVVSGKWQYPMGQGTAVIQGYNASPALINDVVESGGISTFSAGQMLQYGPVYAHNSVATADFSMTAASPSVVTTVTPHGLKSGDVVIFEGLFQTATTGMPQMNGIPFTVTVTNTTTFSVPWDASGSNYTAFDSAASTGNVGSWKQVLYPYLYFPGTTFISAITAPNGTTIPYGTVQVDTTDAHNFVAGQEVAFRIPSQWGSVELNSLPNIPTPGSPIYGYVDRVVDYNSVIVRTPFANTFTAFNVNHTVASVIGLSYPQIVAVGDVNTGGVQISSGSALYPPPYYVPIGDANALSNGVYTQRFNTINGPAIKGAYVNNTRQGFIIGSGAGLVLTDATMVGADTNLVYWRALYHDMGLPF